MSTNRWASTVTAVAMTVLLAVPELTAEPALAATPSWTPAGFGGAGAFIGIAFDRSRQGVVYALSDVSGVHRSTDWGDHWEIRSVGLGNLKISLLAVGPFDGTTLFAGAGSSVHYS